MRLALFSDVHGNSIALDAVLDDIAAQGSVDAYWVLGDLAAIGYDPVGVLERLVALPNVRFTRGNTDRYVVAGGRSGRDAATVRANPDLLETVIQIAGGFAWTQGFVTATGWYDWLADLPLEQRLTLPDGTHLLGVHASPGRDDGDGIFPAQDDRALARLLDGCQADLVCVGHSHAAMDRAVNGVRVVNLGSVSNPTAPDLRASYVLLEADEAGYRLAHRRVPYDLAAVIDAVERSHHPAAPFIVQYFQGRHRPFWE